MNISESTKKYFGKPFQMIFPRLSLKLKNCLSQTSDKRDLLLFSTCNGNLILSIHPKVRKYSLTSSFHAFANTKVVVYMLHFLLLLTQKSATIPRHISIQMVIKSHQL